MRRVNGKKNPHKGPFLPAYLDLHSFSVRSTHRSSVNYRFVVEREICRCDVPDVVYSLTWSPYKNGGVDGGR